MLGRFAAYLRWPVHFSAPANLERCACLLLDLELLLVGELELGQGLDVSRLEFARAGEWVVLLAPVGTEHFDLGDEKERTRASERERKSYCNTAEAPPCFSSQLVRFWRRPAPPTHPGLGLFEVLREALRLGRGRLQLLEGKRRRRLRGHAGDRAIPTRTNRNRS